MSVGSARHPALCPTAHHRPGRRPTAFLLATSLVLASAPLTHLADAAPTPPNSGNAGTTATPGVAGGALSPTVSPAEAAALRTVQQALTASEATDLHRWAYTVTTVTDGRKSIEKHDPAAAAGTRWQLLLKDDRKPTKEDLQKYAEKKRRPGSDPRQPKLHDLIDPASLQVVSNDARRIICNFRIRPADTDNQAFVEKLRGTVVVRPDPPTLESAEIVNIAKISKQPVFSLSEFRARLEFQPGPAGSPPLPHGLEFTLRGRALLLKSLNKDIRITFSEYLRPESDAAASAQPSSTPAASP